MTGGAGFIGSHIVHRLVADGHEVMVVDDLSTGARENLLAVWKDIVFLEGSICDRKALERVFEGAECVFHQAALASVKRSVDDPLSTNRANVEGTLNVLEVARRSGVRRVVYASSSSVYGDAPTLPKHEEMVPAPKSPYAVSKLAGEYYCRVYAELFGLGTVSLRYFNVFGPRQDPGSPYAAVVPIFVKAILEGAQPTVFGDGEHSRDFTYVDNVVQANLLAARAEGAPGQVFNVGCGGSFTLNELIKKLGKILGMDVTPIYAPERPGDVRHSRADIQRARRVLGYEPSLGFEEGLKRTVEWLRARHAGGPE